VTRTAWFARSGPIGERPSTRGPSAGAAADRSPAGLLALALLVVAAMLLGPATSASASPQPPPTPLVEGPLPSAAPPPEVTASSWVLVDADTGQVLAEQAADQRRPVASTIKILTALSVIDRADLDDEVTVGEEVEVGGASVGLLPGDTWSIEELLDALIARSGNDAAEALAVHVADDMESFVELMREDAVAIGLEDLVVTEASGLEDGNELTALELATVSRVALADERLRPLFARERVDLPREGSVATRNELLAAYPDATGMKTGFTAAAGLSLVASAQRDDRELIAVVLDAEEDPARFQDAIALLDHGFEDFASTDPSGDWTVLVAGGQRSVTLGSEPFSVPADAEVELVGLPPVAVPGGQRMTVPVHLDGTPLAELTAELSSPPPPAEGAAELGRRLVDQVHAGMRRTVAEEAW
jgi:serine-type D-Ala-D-Ala carboxypeptidase (penicillin-binding protein 5/6)